MSLRRMMTRVFGWPFRMRLLAVVGLVFSTLVAFRIHGSSIAIAASVWAPEEAEDHYLATPILNRLGARGEPLRDLLMARSKGVRGDEWAHQSIWMQSQFSHEPRFPIVNTNIGFGQNMLAVPEVPVWAWSTLSRPVSWGYFLLGPERGLAYNWWFRPFSGFVGLFLLFEIIFPRNRWLAVFGAMWFVSSAFVICWSCRPAMFVGSAALATVWLYRLITSSSRPTIWGCAVGLGLALPAFATDTYPPWQVPLCYVFGLIFVGLAVRDRLHGALRLLRGPKLLAMALAVIITLVILVSFLHDARGALEALIQSAYPGLRRLRGEDFPLWKFFAGFYNYRTTRTSPPELLNESEASGFFLLVPSVLASLLFSRRVRRAFDPVAIAMLALFGFILYFGDQGIPNSLASVTLWSRAQGTRAQIAVGPVSIILSLYLLKGGGGASATGCFRRLLQAVTIFGFGAFCYYFLGREFETGTSLLPVHKGEVSIEVLEVSLASAAVGTAMALGFRRIAALAILAAAWLTCGNFNPLVVGFADWRKSELAAAIGDVSRKDVRDDDKRSLWLSYGGTEYPNNGLILALFGARGLANVYYHPQLDIWKTLDPSGADRFKYNRYHILRLHPAQLGNTQIDVQLPFYLLVDLTLSPLHPALHDLGAKYAITFGNDIVFAEPTFKLLYRGKKQPFAIWQIPPF